MPNISTHICHFSHVSGLFGQTIKHLHLALPSMHMSSILLCRRLRRMSRTGTETVFASRPCWSMQGTAVKEPWWVDVCRNISDLFLGGKSLAQTNSARDQWQGTQAQNKTLLLTHQLSHHPMFGNRVNEQRRLV